MDIVPVQVVSQDLGELEGTLLGNIRYKKFRCNVCFLVLTFKHNYFVGVLHELLFTVNTLLDL